MSAQTDTQETEANSDGPLLDLTDAGVKKFIKQAKARGYVTMEELNKVLPSEEVTPDAIEDTLAMLSEMGVNVVEAEDKRFARIKVLETVVSAIQAGLNISPPDGKGKKKK